jgi:cytochrome P450
VEATIAEISRINPIAPMTIPHTTLRDTELGGYIIKKVIYAFHHITSDLCGK